MTTVVPQIPKSQLESYFRGKNILIVGGTAGIGKALSISCLRLGANVTVVGRRDPTEDLAAAKFVRKDLSLMKTAAALADEIDVAGLDAIVFTNGIITNPVRQESGEGLELDMAVSYLSRLVFSRRALEKGFGSKRVDQAHKPRIFVMGYPGASVTPTVDDFNSERKYSAIPAHMNTVAGNEALVTYLNREGKGAVNVYGLNPGMIRTDIRDNYLGKGSWTSWAVEGIIGWISISPATYADDYLVHILASPLLEDKPGLFVDQKRKIIAGNPYFAKEENLGRVISESLKLVDRALGKPSN